MPVDLRSRRFRRARIAEGPFFSSLSSPIVNEDKKILYLIQSRYEMVIVRY